MKPVEYLRSRPIPVLALVEAMRVVLLRRKKPLLASGRSKGNTRNLYSPLQRRLELEKSND